MLTGDRQRDNKLVFGFIRGLFLSKEFVKGGMVEPSMDIMRLIEMFYNVELLHHIDCIDGKVSHRVIPIDSVLY